jgi:spore maturation protein CgeB
VAGVNLRLFEAAGSGAVVLSEFRPTIPDLFAVGEEILTFQDFEEPLEQTSRLLHEADRTGRLGDAAARRDHIVAQRVATIIEKVA